MKKITTLLLATTLTLGTAVTASAIDTSGKVKGRTTNTTYDSRDDRDDARHELRQRINAKHREYISLRQAGDPRAEDSLRELQALKAEWHQQYGGKKNAGVRSDKSQGKAHGKFNKGKQK